MANTFVGYHSVVNNCILDEGVHINRFCYIGFETSKCKMEGDITILGKGVVVPACTAVGCKSKLFPHVGTDTLEGGLIPAGSIIIKSQPQ